MAIEDALRAVAADWAGLEPRLTVTELAALAGVSLQPADEGEGSLQVLRIVSAALPPGHEAWSALLSSGIRFQPAPPRAEPGLATALPKATNGGKTYTLTLRKGYDWGPGGVTSATKGLPATVVLKVVTNMTTGANLLLSGGANIGEVVGPDTQRLSSLYSQSVDAPFGVLWFNQKQGTPTAQEPVRKALTESLQLTQLGQVLTSGTGAASTGMVTAALSPCKGNTVSGNLPAYDQSAAKSALAGKNLSIAVYYPTSLGSGGAAAAELLQSTWSQLGVKVSLHGITDAELDSEIVAGTAAWNVAIVPIGLTTPSELVPFVSGATPPTGEDFSYIKNAAYTADVTKASSAAGSAGCPDWNAAETELYKDVDLVPFVDSAIATYAKGATFSLSQGSVMPASIRMLG